MPKTTSKPKQHFFEQINILTNNTVYRVFLILLHSYILCIYDPSAGFTEELNCTSKNSIKGRVYTLHHPMQFKQSMPKLDAETSNIKGIKAGDFNGDGYSDIILQEAAGDKALLYLSVRGEKLVLSNWTNIPTIPNLDHILIGDLNGDSCTDLAIHIEKANWNFWASNCQDGFTTPQLLKFPDSPSLPPDPIKQALVVSHPNGNCPMIIVCNNQLAISSNCIVYYCSKWLAYTVASLTGINGLLFSANFGKEHGRLLVQYLPEYNSTVRNGSAVWNDTPIGIWATFPTSYKWSRGGVGDINGDGISDIITYSDGLLGWWVGLSTARTAIEIPTTGISKPQNKSSPLFALGDFNGNGIEEIIVASGQNELAIFEVAIESFVSNVGISLSGSPLVKTDHNGYFSFGCVDNGNYTLSAQKGDFAFSSPTRNVYLYPKVIPKIYNFQAFNLASGNDNDSIGNSLLFAGDKPGPYVCLGYNYSRDNFSKWVSGYSNECPANYSTLATAMPSYEANTKEIFIRGSCCRLPSDDILIQDSVVYVESECPADHIVTGDKFNSSPSGEVLYGETLLRCSKINTARYTLGQRTEGVAFGVASSFRHRDIKLDREDLPLAFRYGAQRESETSWSRSGCVGYPWGSLLVSKSAGKCNSLGFAQLQYKGAPGDPPLGTPVKIFPDCNSIDNIYDPTSGCKPVKND